MAVLMINCSHLCLLLLLISLSFPTARAKVPAIIVFGDSSVDAGNNNFIPTVARSNFQPYGRDFNGGRPTGRFSNGRIATDFISQSFGLKPAIPAYLDPAYNISDFATGVTFASAGTGYDNATSSVLSVIPLWKELDYYKEYQQKLRGYMGDQKAYETITQALHIISVGTNDFLENYYTIPGGRSAQFSISAYQDFLTTIAANFIRKLYGLGARKISLGGLPPMGCMPLERTNNFMGGYDCVRRLNDLAMEFNGRLKKLVGNLNLELHGINVVFSNPYFALLHTIRRPALYGFETTGVACCSTGMFEMGYACDQNNPFTCTDASKYVFWDAFHPTEKANQIVAGNILRNALAKFLH